MRFGLDVANFGPHVNPRALAELARDAEAAGWDGFFIFDCLMGMDEVEPDTFRSQLTVDPWVALAAIASATERIRIGPLVTPLPRRRPWKLARESVTLDHLSNGRLILGVGLGDIAADPYDVFPEEADPKRRAPLLDEGLDILTGLWGGKPFSYAGNAYQVREVTFLPPPLQQPRIPIWCGGYWPNKRPYRRAARWDGIVLGGQYDLDTLPDIVAYIHNHRDNGEPFDVIVEVGAHDSSQSRAPDALAAWVAAGATWWIEGIWQEFPGDLEDIRAIIRRGPPRA